MSAKSVARIAAVVGVALPWLAGAQTVPTHQAAEHLHRDPRSYMAALDDPRRDGWQKPHEVVTALGVKDGDRVADIGAGTGYFALRFAHHVGTSGRVYAVDISEHMVAEVKSRAGKAGLRNVVAVHAAPNDPRLPAGGVDTIFICDTWHHIEARTSYARLLQQALSPDGRLVIVDFKKDSPVGPPREMKLTREEVVKEIEAAGYTLATEHTFLPHQYFLVFTRRGS